MPALPPTLESYRDQPSVLSAYNICLRLQKRIQCAIDSGKDMTKEMMYCRVLGSLFHHLPAPAVNGDLVRSVTTISSDDEKLLELGKFFYEHFIKPFMSSREHTPTPSSHSSRRSFDDPVDGTNEVPKSHESAKKHALVRDGFRCIVTKLYDGPATVDNDELEKAVMAGGMPPVETQCTHIFPQSVNANITSDSNKAKYTSSVWAVLDRFGYPGLLEDLNGANIHRLENVMTMDPTVHRQFETLKIWFVAMEEPNTYRLEAANKLWLFGRPEYVTFSTPDPEKYPLPNPTYLALHATCAKVAHLSGAREYIEEVSRRMEDTCVLAEDGGSSDILHEAILSSMWRVQSKAFV
ncbi:hypothetical protein EDC04DRAFT_3065675 [Pisolithus marmoratus]|nr:hypothetical protein EDC04DRAFT_3065675 [Pisolithus marmoratus]